MSEDNFIIRYDIVESWARIPSGLEYKIVKGCTFDFFEYEPLVDCDFDTYEEACEYFKALKTKIECYGYGVTRYYIVTEYYIAKSKYDRYYRLRECEMASDVSPMSIKVIELLQPRGSKVVAELNSLGAAQAKAKNLSIKYQKRDFRVDVSNGDIWNRKRKWI